MSEMANLQGPDWVRVLAKRLGKADEGGLGGTSTTNGVGFSVNTLFSYSYSYTPSGQVTGKRLQMATTTALPKYPYSNTVTTNFDQTCTYDWEGHVLTQQYPDPPISGYPNGLTYTYGFDTMRRPVSMQEGLRAF